MAAVMPREVGGDNIHSGPHNAGDHGVGQIGGRLPPAGRRKLEAVEAKHPHPEARFREDAKGRKGLGASPFGALRLTTAPGPCASVAFLGKAPLRCSRTNRTNGTNGTRRRGGGRGEAKLPSLQTSKLPQKKPRAGGSGLFGEEEGDHSSGSAVGSSTMSSEVMGSSAVSSAPVSWTWGKRSARGSSASRSSSGTGMVSVAMPFSSFLP